jgi:ABC-type multidrug transport system ATPase subunit
MVASFERLVRVEGVGVTVGHRRPVALLRNITFDVHSGEAFAICGGNGSGKSTLLGVMSGVVSPSVGGLLSGPQSSPSVSLRRRYRLAAVAQANSLDEKLSVKDNLLLSGALYGLRRASAQAYANDLLEHFGLGDRLNARVAVLSGGEKRKVDLIRALLPDPEVLLLDEACSGLDQGSVLKVWELLRGHLADPGRLLRSVIFVTHRADELEYADRVVLMNAGSLALECRRADLVAAESFDRLTVGFDDESLVGRIVEVVGRPVVSQSQGQLEFLVQSGHLLIPRIFEGLEPGSVRHVELGRENLLDKLSRLGSGSSRCSALGVRGAAESSGRQVSPAALQPAFQRGRQ